MKILVIQLTRLGDILCTLPTLSSLKRDFPEAQIHFLVRKSFADAASLGSVVDHHWYLDSEKLISPMIMGDGQYGQSLNSLTQLVGQLRLERFDKIINLSFSPSSSFLTHLISRGQIPVSGYTRTSDFYLHIPDEASRYFRAQVSLEKSNRIHVVDLMAWVAGTSITENDLTLLNQDKSGEEIRGIVCHLGASDAKKIWPLEYWMNLIRSIIQELNLEVTLVGGKKELELGDMVVRELNANKLLTNKIGSASLRELVQLLGKSELFVGADSGPLHAASLAGCKALNLSVGNVRFWETGPLLKDSRVLVKKNPYYLTPETVFSEVTAIIDNRNNANSHSIRCCSLRDSVRYFATVDSKVPEDSWEAVKWLYFKGPKPVITPVMEIALKQCIETCEIGLKQAEVFYSCPERIEISNILDRLDQVFNLIKMKVPFIAPLVDDYFCEKANIPPGSREEVFCQTDVCYRNLMTLCQSFLTKSQTTEKGLAL